MDDQALHAVRSVRWLDSYARMCQMIVVFAPMIAGQCSVQVYQRCCVVIQVGGDCVGFVAQVHEVSVDWNLGPAVVADIAVQPFCLVVGLALVAGLELLGHKQVQGGVVILKDPFDLLCDKLVYSLLGLEIVDWVNECFANLVLAAFGMDTVAHTNAQAVNLMVALVMVNIADLAVVLVVEFDVGVCAGL